MRIDRPRGADCSPAGGARRAGQGQRKKQGPCGQRGGFRDDGEGGLRLDALAEVGGHQDQIADGHIAIIGVEVAFEPGGGTGFAEVIGEDDQIADADQAIEVGIAGDGGDEQVDGAGAIVQIEDQAREAGLIDHLIEPAIIIAEFADAVGLEGEGGEIVDGHDIEMAGQFGVAQNLQGIMLEAGGGAADFDLEACGLAEDQIAFEAEEGGAVAGHHVAFDVDRAAACDGGGTGEGTEEEGGGTGGDAEEAVVDHIIVEGGLAGAAEDDAAGGKVGHIAEEIGKALFCPVMWLDCANKLFFVLATFDNVCYPLYMRHTASPKADLLTVTEAAEILGVSPSTLRNWDRVGKLKAKRHPFNSYRLYERSQLERLLKAITGRR